MTEIEPANITVQIWRGTPEQNWIDAYSIPYEQGRSILGGLKYIHEHLDPTLAFSSSCRIGLCASCVMRVNGKVVRACTTLLRDDVQIEPFRPECAVRDLVVGLDDRSS